MANGSVQRKGKVWSFVVFNPAVQGSLGNVVGSGRDESPSDRERQSYVGRDCPDGLRV